MQVEAFTSMVMVSLPFPPLPVVCLRSEECTDAHASGHDLLSSAISSMMIGSGDKAGFDSIDIREKKQSIVMGLNDTISQVWRNRERNTKDNDAAAIEECYKIFCSSYREYMTCYPGSTDLRILNMQDVGKDTTIVRQAVEHLNAKSTTFVGDTIVKCSVPESMKGHYPSLIHMYITDMYSQRRKQCT